MFMPRLAAAVLVLSCAACASQETPPAPAAAQPDMSMQAAVRGQQFATQACAGCHAVGPDGASPLTAAPPFRDVVHRYSMDRLEGRFAEGLVTSHPAMPAFVFRASEIDDLMAYLETLRAEP